jgi:hypothetical protein
MSLSQVKQNHDRRQTEIFRASEEPTTMRKEYLSNKTTSRKKSEDSNDAYT